MFPKPFVGDDEIPRNGGGRKKHRKKQSFLAEDFDINKHFEKSK